MKASVYFGPKDIRCTNVPDAAIRAHHEILVKVKATSICGSDLHLYRGALDAIMERGHSQTGHELIGEVIQVGKGVGRFTPGDRVSMGYSVSCGHCYMCEVGQTAHCETTKNAVYGFGLPFGDMNGTHAEALVIPHADGHAMKIPLSVSDEAAITLSCNLPSAIIANRLADIQVGEKVALIGCGPTGMMTLDIALQRGPGRVVVLDKVTERLEGARQKGAVAIDVNHVDWKQMALSETGGRGFDKVIEVVGYPETFQMCLDLVRPGGTVAAIGVFCDAPFNLNLADVFLRNISLHMNGFASVRPYMWEAMRMIEQGVITPAAYFSHTFELTSVDKAFSLFDEKKDGVSKVLIRP
ncbi:alcohol dehydrogenase [Paraburkholderia aspalathi]|uniref:alcohol dehydrogenase n=1 Tax=Paraburkholderia aspalathi TaxID=1324617 RepID=UPI001B03DC36|nr:alcohol dehydrogenase [Paraburkholderia aspalathi]CAE6848445.1 putative zinc-binding alcohol dehydrogenase [Paraburkholderia aspalathi]